MCLKLVHKWYNRDKEREENEKNYMAILSKAVLMSALGREETRGSHIRTDFPETGKEFQKCSVAEYKDHTIHISYKDEVENES